MDANLFITCLISEVMSLVTPDVKESNFRSSYSNNMSVGEVVLRINFSAVMAFPSRRLPGNLCGCKQCLCKKRSAVMQLFQRSCPVFSLYNALL